MISILSRLPTCPHVKLLQCQTTFPIQHIASPTCYFVTGSLLTFNPLPLLFHPHPSLGSLFLADTIASSAHQTAPPLPGSPHPKGLAEGAFSNSHKSTPGTENAYMVYFGLSCVILLQPLQHSEAAPIMPFSQLRKLDPPRSPRSHNL